MDSITVLLQQTIILKSSTKLWQHQEKKHLKNHSDLKYVPSVHNWWNPFLPLLWGNSICWVHWMKWICYNLYNSFNCVAKIHVCHMHCLHVKLKACIGKLSWMRLKEPFSLWFCNQFKSKIYEVQGELQLPLNFNCFRICWKSLNA